MAPHLVLSASGAPGEKPVLRSACGQISPKTVLLVSWLGYFFVYIARKPFAVCKKTLSGTMDLTPAQLGALDTAFLAMYTCGSFGGGLLGDKYGERAVLTCVLAGSSLACALFASSSTPESFAAAWALNGLMQGVPYPCYMKLLATSFGARLGSAAGLWQSSAYVGGGVGNLLAGSLLTRFDWPAAFWTPSLALLFMTVLTYLLTPLLGRASAKASGADTVELQDPAESSPTMARRRSSREKAGDDDDDDEKPLARRAGVAARRYGAACCATARGVVAIPSLVEVSAAYFLVKLVRYALLFWLPYYLVNERKYSPAVAGPMASCFELGGLIGCPLAGWATDSLAGGLRFRVVMPLLCCTALFLLLYADGYALLVGVDPHSGALAGIEETASSMRRAEWVGIGFDMLVLSGLGICISGPDSIYAGPAAQDIGQNSGGLLGPATVVGMVDGLGSLGSVLQGSVTAAVTSTLGWPAMFRLSACFLMASCALTVRPSQLEARRRRDAIATKRVDV